MKKKLSQQRLKEIFQPLETANNSHQKIYPDLLKNQQPLHTVLWRVIVLIYLNSNCRVWLVEY